MVINRFWLAAQPYGGLLGFTLVCVIHIVADYYATFIRDKEEDDDTYLTRSHDSAQEHFLIETLLLVYLIWTIFVQGLSAKYSILFALPTFFFTQIASLAIQHMLSDDDDIDTTLTEKNNNDSNAS